MMHAFNSAALTPEADWPNAVTAIQSVVNNSPSRRLGGRAPITAHTGMPSGNPLTVALTNCTIQGVENTDQERILQRLNIDISSRCTISRDLSTLTVKQGHKKKKKKLFCF